MELCCIFHGNIGLKETNWEIVVLIFLPLHTHTVHAHIFKIVTQSPPGGRWILHGTVKGMFLGFGFHHAALRELYHPHGLKSLSQWEVVCAHIWFCACVCMCAYVHNVFMHVVIQPSSEILCLVFISQTSSVRLGAKPKDLLVLKA